MTNILQKIVENKKQEVEILRRELIYEETPRRKIKSFKSSLLSDGLSVIAEIKRRSPSKGELSLIQDPVLLAHEYIQGGARAISVLTDKQYFGGSIKDLAKVSDAVEGSSVTILRKDFIIDPIQITEAILAGADAILLIVAVLKDRLKELLDYAKKMNIDALVEVHNMDELKIAMDAGSEIIGINNRDLKTFHVDINQSLKLIKYMPKDIIKVSESGVRSPEIAKQLYNAGFDAVLVGELLVQSKNPGNLIRQMGGML